MQRVCTILSVLCVLLFSMAAPSLAQSQPEETTWGRIKSLYGQEEGRIERPDQLEPKYWGDPMKWPTSIWDFKLPFSGWHNMCAPEYWKVICGYGCGYHTNTFYPGAGTYSIDLVRVDGRTIDSAVLAAARGIVAFAGGKTGYGNCVEMDHGNGFKSIYAHLRENPWRYVSTGDDLRAGTFLGWASDTGWANPAHIHFSVWQWNRSIPLDGISGYGRIQQGSTYCSGLARVPSPKNSPF